MKFMQNLCIHTIFSSSYSEYNDTRNKLGETLRYPLSEKWRMLSEWSTVMRSAEQTPVDSDISTHNNHSLILYTLHISFYHLYLLTDTNSSTWDFSYLQIPYIHFGPFPKTYCPNFCLLSLVLVLSESTVHKAANWYSIHSASKAGYQTLPINCIKCFKIHLFIIRLTPLPWSVTLT